MRPDLRTAIVLTLLGVTAPSSIPAQDPQLVEPSLRAPLEPLVDQTGTFVLTLEIDPLAGETLVSDDFTVALGVNVPAPDALFSDSFESN